MTSETANCSELRGTSAKHGAQGRIREAHVKLGNIAAQQAAGLT